MSLGNLDLIVESSSRNRQYVEQSSRSRLQAGQAALGNRSSCGAEGLEAGASVPKGTSTGDGVLASFDGPGRAIRCACAIGDAVRPLGLDIRAGLHSGEIELRGDDVAGMAVHIGRGCRRSLPGRYSYLAPSPTSWLARASSSWTAESTSSKVSRESGTCSRSWLEVPVWEVPLSGLLTGVMGCALPEPSGRVRRHCCGGGAGTTELAQVILDAHNGTSRCTSGSAAQ